MPPSGQSIKHRAAIFGIHVSITKAHVYTKLQSSILNNENMFNHFLLSAKFTLFDLENSQK